MKLTGLHLLLTYQCTFECDHCFTWGSPWQEGTMTLADIRNILNQARMLGTVEWIFFEGGEPFLYYPVLLRGVEEAARCGFKVGIVTNGYWATEVEDAREWLAPLSRLICDLTISSDLYHYDEKLSRQARNASGAAEELGISRGILSVAQLPNADGAPSRGQLPQGESSVMFRGRAARELAKKAGKKRWDSFTSCPHEDLREPGRVHIDPLGNVHVCQGIAIGNLFKKPLRAIAEDYDPDASPVIGSLLRGGPVELVGCHGLAHKSAYADACHLCYEARLALRDEFPEILAPDQMYGVPGEE